MQLKLFKQTKLSDSQKQTHAYTTHTYIHTNTHTYTHIHTWTHTHPHMDSPTHTHIYINIYLLSSTDRSVSFYQNSSVWLDSIPPVAGIETRLIETPIQASNHLATRRN